MGGIQFSFDPWEDEPLLKAWDYGMWNQLSGDWPRPNNHIFTHFTHFQKKIFHVLESWGRKYSIKHIPISSACIESETNLPKSAHHLVYLLLEEDIRPLKRPVITFCSPIITDPTLARALGFFFIYQYLKLYKKTDCLVFRVGFTSIIASPSIKPLLQNIIPNTDSVDEYMSNIIEGRYQSHRGHDHLINYLIDWDLNFCSSIVNNNYADGDDDLEALIGEEGIFNLANAW